MQANNDQEYLQREILPNVKFDITSERVYICNESTSWCNIFPVVHIKKAEIEDLYSQVLALARTYKTNVSVSYKQHIRKSIDIIYPEYKKEYDRAVKLYGSIVKQARIVQNRGIHYGCSDDEALNKLSKLNAEYTKIYWRTTAYSRLREIYKHLQETLRYLQLHCTNNDIVKISIVL